MSGPPKQRTDRGYVLVLLPEHPAAHADGYVFEHRLVMEEYLGEPLRPGEIVHHRDRRPSNNALNNLLLCVDKVVHQAVHDAIDKDQPRLLQSLEQWMIREAAHRAEKNRRLASTSAGPIAATVGLDGLRERALEPLPPQATEQRDEGDTLLEVVDAICAISNKEDRGAYLAQLGPHLAQDALVAAMIRRIDMDDPVITKRVIWTLGELKVDAGGPVFTAVLRSSTIPSIRQAVYSALKKRVYPTLDTEHLATEAVRERGQPLQYAVAAVAMQCDPKRAIAVIQAIAAVPDPEYSREALDRTVRRWVAKLRRPGGDEASSG